MLEVLEDDAGVGVLLRVVAPDVEVACGAAAFGAPRTLKPGVLVGRVVADQLRDHSQPAAVGLADERAHVREVAVGRVHRRVVGDVIAVIEQRRRIEGQQPDRRDAQVLKIVQLFGQPAEVADAVVVAVGEGADVQLVDDRVLVPERVSREWYAGESAFRHRHP